MYFRSPLLLAASLGSARAIWIHQPHQGPGRDEMIGTTHSRLHGGVAPRSDRRLVQDECHVPCLSTMPTVPSSPVAQSTASLETGPTLPGYSLSSTAVPASTTSNESLSISCFSKTTTLASKTSTYLTMSPTSVISPNFTSPTACTSLCPALQFPSDLDVSPVSCEYYAANSTITIEGGQAIAQCGSTIQPELDICRVVLTITTSSASQVYMEVWLPNGNDSAWNGRTMSTDNGGLNGCVHFDDMQYVSGLGFAAIGDNGGHNSSAWTGAWMFENNEQLLDWTYRARHDSVVVGKQVIDQFYGQQANYSYFLGCSTGGQQGLHSAQYYPEDFDGIIAGSPAADFNHLQDWSGRFVQLTGTNTNDSRYLTYDDWLLVQGTILDQCDEALDEVPDGILEDPTICQFNASVLACSGNSTANCLTETQVTSVQNVFSALFDTLGDLLFPALLYGSEIDAFRLGMLDGSVQSVSANWFQDGVYNNSDWNPYHLNQTDYQVADSLDEYHGNVSSFAGDLSGFQRAGGKMIMYHGMADPLVSGANSQRYYLKVAETMGLDYTQIDPFMRFFRISGMVHCGVDDISGAGAWMFGQSSEASIGADNIVWNLVDWVENDVAPDVIVGTKYWYDEEDLGIEFERPHCRFPYRTTYEGGDWNLTSAWGCTFIEDWQNCGVGALPRLCNVDGSFT